jgi:Flp pilus assembly protein TadD
MHDRAIEDLNTALGIAPDDSDLYDSRGEMYYNKGDYNRARTDWNRALQLDPNNTYSKANLEKLRNEGH